MHCVMSAGGADNDDANSNNAIFPIKCTKLDIHVVTLWPKYN